MITVTRKESFRNSTSTTHEVDYADDIQTGDFVFAFLSFDGNPTITMPAGWTELARHNPSNTGALYYRIAESALSGSFTVTTSTSEPFAALVYRIRGDRLVFKFNEFQYNASETEVQMPTVEQLFDPTEVLMLTSFFGINTGHLTTIQEYPYEDNIYINSGSTGTQQTAILGSHGTKIANKETPVLTKAGGSMSGAMTTIMVYEERLQYVTPTTGLVGLGGTINASVVGEVDENAIYFDNNLITGAVKINDSKVSFEYPPSNDVETVPVKIGIVTDYTPDFYEASFSYLPPRVLLESVTPTGTGLDTAQPIVITGSNFRNDSVVTIDDVPCDDIVVVDEETITCTVPASAVQKVATLKVTAGDGSEVKTNFFYMDIVPTPPTKTKVRARFIVEPIDYIQ